MSMGMRIHAFICTLTVVMLDQRAIMVLLGDRIVAVGGPVVLLFVLGFFRHLYKLDQLR